MSQPVRILIDGVGLVSPLGRSAWSTFSALLEGRCLTDRLTAGGEGDSLSGLALEGQVAQIGKAWGMHPGAPDPAIDLAESAARQALLEAGQTERGHGCASSGDEPGRSDGLPVIVATSKGAMVAWESAVRGFFHGRLQHHPAAAAMLGLEPDIDRCELARVVAMGPASWLSEQLGRRLGAHVSMQPSVVAACASGLVAVDQARRKLLSPSGPSRCLVVATEAALLPVLIHSYRRLGVLATHRRKLVPGRPLHPDRDGFVLAQLSAAVLLRRESTSTPQAGDSAAIELVDTAVANETHDLIRPAPGMPALDRIASRLLSGRSVVALHPHATGTREHDPAELEVLERYLTKPAALYACKGAVGHGLGAAGLVSLVLACMSVRAGRLPPMPWLDRLMAMPGGPGMLAARAESDSLNGDSSEIIGSRGGERSAHAVFAAGFGGHTAGAVIAPVGGD